MNRRSYLTTIITASVIASFSLLSFIYFVNRKQNQEKNLSPLSSLEESASSAPSLSLEELKSNPKLKIHTEKGILEVNNVYRNSVRAFSDNWVTFAENDDYSLGFYSPDESFIITLNNEDVFTARKRAEKALIKILGITQEEACLLNIFLGVSFQVNEKYSGEDYGLSFCPNGKNF